MSRKLKNSPKPASKPHQGLLVVSIIVFSVPIALSLLMVILLVSEALGGPAWGFLFFLVVFGSLLVSLFGGASWVGVVIGRAKIRKGKSFWVPYSITLGSVAGFLLLSFVGLGVGA